MTDIIIDGANGGDNFRSRLNAAEEGGNEDAVYREIEARLKIAGSRKSSDSTRIYKRRIPRSIGFGSPERIKIVDAVAVAHNDDVLIAVAIVHWRSE